MIALDFAEADLDGDGLIVGNEVTELLKKLKLIPSKKKKKADNKGKKD